MQSRRNTTPIKINASSLTGDEVNIPYDLYKWHGGNRWWPLSLISLALTFLVGLAALGGSNSWPSEDQINPLLGNEPVIGVTSEKPFTMEVDGVVSEVYPIREYTQAALITSMAENSTGWLYVPGIGLHDQKINAFDGTVAWGKNVTLGSFRLMNYQNEGFVGYAVPRYVDVFMATKFGPGGPPKVMFAGGCGKDHPPVPEYTDKRVFRSWEWANNHYIPSSPKIQKLIKSLVPGDQIFLRGLLVRYRIKSASAISGEGDGSTSPETSPFLEPAADQKNYKRREITAAVKVDDLNWRGHPDPNFYDDWCEMIYVQELRVLRRHNFAARTAFKIFALVTACLIAVGSFVHFFIPPR
jgi:hypothetical protein